MALTPYQKQAGRIFRDERQAVLDALNAVRPPARYVLTQWRVVRHLCPDRDGASVGISLREVREDSPEYWGCYCSAPPAPHSADFPHSDCQGGMVVAAESLFGFVWKEGRCSGCGQELRSRRGLIEVSDHLSRDGQASAHT